MRRCNMFLVMGIVATFLLHAIMGATLLLGGSNSALKVVARICLTLVAAHIVITGILTFRTLKAIGRSGRGYFKENKMFWVRRLSGLAMLIPLIMHLTIFTAHSAGAYRLTAFTTGRMISQLLLVITLGLHIITNIRPLMISLGLNRGKGLRVDIILILSAVLLMFSIAFLVYYLRWMRV